MLGRRSTDPGYVWDRNECFVYLVEDVVEAGLVEKPYEFLRGKVRNTILHDSLVYLKGSLRARDGFVAGDTKSAHRLHIVPRLGKSYRVPSLST